MERHGSDSSAACASQCKNGTVPTEGGAFYADGSVISITNGSFICNCSAPVGATLQILASVVTYVFPALAGYWLPQTECLVYREPCPGGPDGKDCRDNFAACTLQRDVGSNPPEGCQPSAAVQPCAWKIDASLMLKRVYQLPVRALSAQQRTLE
eukprot:4158412-Pleurochrysis_carterae.AAC.4